jgi:anti-anti-sigma factor
MEIKDRKAGETVVVTVTGRIDAVTAPEFEKRLSGWIAGGEKLFLLNFAGLDYISSAGLRSLLSTAKKLRGNQGRIILAGMQEVVAEVIRVAGFDSLFPVFASEEEALAKAL